jgi:hypothetical protein
MKVTKTEWKIIVVICVIFTVVAIAADINAIRCFIDLKVWDFKTMTNGGWNAVIKFFTGLRVGDGFVLDVKSFIVIALAMIANAWSRACFKTLETCEIIE